MAVDLAPRTTLTILSTAKTVNLKPPLKPPFAIGSPPFDSTHEIFIRLLDFCLDNGGRNESRKYRQRVCSHFKKYRTCRFYWKRSSVLKLELLHPPRIEVEREG